MEATEEEDKQSATARRSGSGGFFKDEDLNLETTPSWSCSLELPGLFRDGLKVDDIEIDGDWCTDYRKKLEFKFKFNLI